MGIENQSQMVCVYKFRSSETKLSREEQILIALRYS